MRGYNLSDKPRGRQNYSLDLLADDVAALIRALGRERCGGGTSTQLTNPCASVCLLLDRPRSASPLLNLQINLVVCQGFFCTKACSKCQLIKLCKSWQFTAANRPGLCPHYQSLELLMLAA